MLGLAEYLNEERRRRKSTNSDKGEVRKFGKVK